MTINSAKEKSLCKRLDERSIVDLASLGFFYMNSFINLYSGMLNFFNQLNRQNKHNIFILNSFYKFFANILNILLPPALRTIKTPIFSS